jgi:predicted metalloprotease with PDZ domain
VRNPVTFRVRVLPALHELEIELHLPARARRGMPIRLELPTWVPGSYRFRAFSRDLFNLRAIDDRSGTALAISRDGWQGFVIEGASGPVRVCYTAYAWEKEFSQHCGIVDSEFAVITGARFLRDPLWRGPYRVIWELPAGWKLHHPAGAAKIGDPQVWEYPDYETLLDTPVAMGRLDVLQRRVAGTAFHFVFVDRALGFEAHAEAFVDRLAEAARECFRIFRSFPFPSYTFIISTNPENRWGLEHRTSSMCGVGQDVFIDPKEMAQGVRVCTHELFHAWNVRALRPAPLGAPDLVAGSFTEGLWLAEGFTRYYEFLVCTRIGLYTAEQFFSTVVNYSNHLRRLPAYARVTATDSSRAAFVNHGKYPGRCNNSIDYYEKGFLIAFDLDAELRLGIPPDSLDRAFADFYRAFAARGARDKTGGYTTDDVLGFFTKLDARLGRRLRREVTEPGSLSVRQHLERIGFAVALRRESSLGLILKGAVIEDVLDTSAAGQASMAPGDSIVGVDGFPFSRKALRWAVERRDLLTLDVRRGHRGLSFTMTPGEWAGIGEIRWYGSEAQAERIRRWLGGGDFRPGHGEGLDLEFHENFHGVEMVI